MTVKTSLLQRDHSLARCTTWRVGGRAKKFFQPVTITDLQTFMQEIPLTESVFFLGLGSNLLIRDGGLQDTVIHTQFGLNQLNQINPTTVRAEVGVPCARFARFCARAGLLGMEFLAGVPGTIGGALAMNAGAHGGETWQFVEVVETIDRQGQLHRRSPKEFQVAYRNVKGISDEWFVSAEFNLQTGKAENSLQAIRQLLEHRAATQPTNKPSCGSVFRNPRDDHAARLIEAAGLKGLQLGRASVSSKHANFILNEGKATAADIEKLIFHVQAVVDAKFGVCLEPEVKIVGQNLQ